MNANTRTTAARAFVRSLNILLKFARMYDFGHPRTAKQYETAWSELRTALGSDNEAGLLLAVSGDQLLLDGVALESAAAEKSFARMLSSAGIASIHFAPTVSQTSLARFVRGFPTGTGAKPAQLAEQLKAALKGDPHIHVNEVCYVPADSSIAKSSVAAHITSRTLGMDSDAANELFNDPEKLLQLIVAAEGTKGPSGHGSGTGSGSGGNGPGGGGDGPGGGYGPGDGSGYGGNGPGGGDSGPGGGGNGPGGGYGPGDGSGYGGNVASGEGQGAGYYSGRSGQGTGGGHGAARGGHGAGGPGGPLQAAGPSGSGAPSTWNIVGGSGGGAPLDPNAGGFWLNKGDAPGSGTGSGGSGAAGSGTVGSGPGGVSSGTPGGPSGGSSGDASTWNIIGGSGSGAPVDPNAGGFWLNKGDAPGSAGGSGSSPVNAAGGISSGGSGGGSGDASTWNVIGGSGGGAPLDPNAGGFWLNKGDAPSTSGHGGPSGHASDGMPIGGTPSAGSGIGSGDAGTWNVIGGSGNAGSLDPNAAGFWLNSNESAGSAQNSGVSAGSTPGGAPVNIPGGRGGTGSGGAGSGPAGSGGGGSGSSGSGTGRHGGGGAPGGGNAGGSTNQRIWRTPASGGGGEGDGAAAGRWANATTGIRSGRPARVGAGQGSMAVETGLMTLQEDELQGILQVLAQIARTGDATKDKLDPGSFQSRLSTLPRRARFTVSQALSALAAQAPTESSDRPTLLKLAEHIAIRFALESYERGDIEVNAVRQVLDDMSGELDGLRKILGVYEEKMARAGIEVKSHVDMLAQQFWSEVTEEKKKSVLESADAWCVPPVKVREYVEASIAKGETEAAIKILRNYANCITNKSHEPRRQAAMGLAELAPLYTKGDDTLLLETIRQVGLQLAEERDSEMQSLVGAAFVRLSQEAAKMRSYPAIQRSVELMDYVEKEHPGIVKNLRPRVAVENRLPEFIEESLKSGEFPSGLADLLRRMPNPASEHLAQRFSRAGFREDCELLVSMMSVLGPEGLEHLREQLRRGSQTEAIDTVGILARMDHETLGQVLPDRMKEWKRTAHDRVVRQIAASGAEDRGGLLLNLFDFLDALIRPLAIDEIGMSGEQSADMKLLRLAEGDLPKNGTEYLRLKAIEALGRLRTAGAEAVLRKIAEARKTFRWANASELRVVAAQAMEKIDPEWVRSFIPRSGLSIAEFSIEPLDADPESSALRQRRYPRLRLEHPVAATTTNLKENCHVEIPEMTLGGGIAVCEQSLYPGSVVALRMNTGQKPVKAQTIVRDANTQARAFEVVDMDLEERAKLRKLLVQLGNALKQSTSKERSRRGPRTILSNPTS